eukprot:415283_1
MGGNRRVRGLSKDESGLSPPGTDEEPQRTVQDSETEVKKASNGATFVSNELGLDQRLVKGLAKAGFIYPTPVQSSCIPLALEGKDLLVRARTGSGKTAAYGLPVLQKILHTEVTDTRKAVRAIVLVPTRELCEQVKQQLSALAAFCGDAIDIVSLSGDNVKAQRARLRDSPNVVISTPSRLVGHLDAGDLELTECLETIVVDEADLVLSFGYRDDMRTLTARLPNICQGFLVSATMNQDLNDLKRIILQNPVVVKLDSGQTDGPPPLTQLYLPLADEKDKLLAIFAFIKLGLMPGKGLLFVNDVDSTFRVKLFLEKFGIRSAVLNAELPLNSRMHILEEFNHGIFDYLLATDDSMDVDPVTADDVDSEGEVEEEDDDEEGGGVLSEGDLGTTETSRERSTSGHTKMGNKQTIKKYKGSNAATANNIEYGVARGVDFQRVHFVLNVDCPPTLSSYVHRIGRTARGGSSGKALTLVVCENEAEVAMLEEVQASQPEVHNDAYDKGRTSTQLAFHSTATPQPMRMKFDIGEVEQFRYRVSDVAKRITRVMIREARLAELKAEIVNSEKLCDYFAKHPDDLKILRHDKATLKLNERLEHLKHVPDYLMPTGLEINTESATRRRKRKRAGVKWQQGSGTNQERRKDNDPLQNFSALSSKSGNRGGSSNYRGMYSSEIPQQASTSGRQKWKKLHNKGKFGGKPRNANRFGNKKTKFNPP